MTLVFHFVLTAVYGATDEWYQFNVPLRIVELRHLLADTIRGTLCVTRCVMEQRMR